MNKGITTTKKNKNRLLKTENKLEVATGEMDRKIGKIAEED